MRLFIAADINSRSKNLIENKLDLIKTDLESNFKWVNKDQLHLTLKFIGEGSEAEKNMLIKALKNINFKEKNRYINFNKIDAFPDLERAKVLYLAVSEGKEFLKSIHNNLEAELSKFDFAEDDRNYIPHLTLGRSKNRSLKIKSKFRDPGFINIYAQIEAVTLYQSKLKPGGPEYIELFSI